MEKPRHPLMDEWMKKWDVYLHVLMCSVTKSFLTLCDPMACSSPGSSVHGIFQARILEWVTTSSSKGLPIPGTEPTSPVSPALTGGFSTTVPPGKPHVYVYIRPTHMIQFIYNKHNTHK